MSSQNRIGLVLVAIVIISVGVMVFARDTSRASDTPFGNVSVACEPSQRAVVQRIEGQAQINVACVDIGVEAAAALSPSAIGQTPPGYAPVAYYPPAAALAPTAAYAPATPLAPQPIPPAAIAAPVAAPSPASPAAGRRAGNAKPSTEKRLLVIGGTAGAGAGIGAIVGGRKGALIGAAIGAGGATLVDQIKHR